MTFVHPIVRSGIYSGALQRRARARHRQAAQLLAEQPGSGERVAEHLLNSEPAADGWVVERLVEGARTPRRGTALPSRLPSSCAESLDEPPPAGLPLELLLELGMAEAIAGLPGWPEHLQRAVDDGSNATAAAGAARVLALALPPSQRFAEAVEALDRASAALVVGDAELALQLEAEAVLAGMIDPAIAASMELSS